MGSLAFRIADTHAHALLARPRADVGKFARTAQTRLRARLGAPVPFARARIRPVFDQGHLYSTFRYILRQRERDGLLADPFHDGSSLLDLLALRAVSTEGGAWVRRFLPRIHEGELRSILGVAELDARLRFEHLGAAAAAALALPSLARRTPCAARAKHAAIQVARAYDRPVAETAECLGLAQRHVFRLRASPADPHLVAVMTRQLQLRSAHHASAERVSLDAAAPNAPRIIRGQTPIPLAEAQLVARTGRASPAISRNL